MYKIIVPYFAVRDSCGLMAKDTWFESGVEVVCQGITRQMNIHLLEEMNI